MNVAFFVYIFCYISKIYTFENYVHSTAFCRFLIELNPAVLVCYQKECCQECCKVWQIFHTGVVIPERSTHIGMYPQSLCYYIGHLSWNGVNGCGSAQYSHSLLDGSLIIWTAFIARKTYRALTEANSVKTIPARHYIVLADPFSGPDTVILFFSSSHYNEHRAASFDIPGVDIQTQLKYCILFCLIVFANLERFRLLSCPSVKIVVNIPH